jgi:hypothetical protein
LRESEKSGSLALYEKIIDKKVLAKLLSVATVSSTAFTFVPLWKLMYIFPLFVYTFKKETPSQMVLKK